MDIIRAAGGILWRAGYRGPEVALVHRPRRGDWSLPKGKLERGESFEEAAVREVGEETGCLVHLGSFAGSRYYVSRRGPKLVLYWHMLLVRERPLPPGSEVDQVAWLAPDDALRRLGRDRRLLASAALEARAVLQVQGRSARETSPRAA